MAIAPPIVTELLPFPRARPTGIGRDYRNYAGWSANMERTMIDGGPRWFDTSKARAWDEDTWWDGSNQISVATHTQWEHERLYRTPKGVWVLCSWSQWEGTPTTYREINTSAAAVWMLANDHEPIAETADIIAHAEV